MNSPLADSPEYVNEDPYDEGWMIQVAHHQRRRSWTACWTPRRTRRSCANRASSRSMAVDIGARDHFPRRHIGPDDADEAAMLQRARASARWTS